MASIKMSVFIDRPQQQVFEFLTNPENDLLWQESLISSEWVTDEPAGVGSKKRVTVRLFGFTLKATTQYTAWDSPTMYSFKSDDSPFSVTASTRLEPKGDGTQVTSEGTLEASGPLKLVVGMVARKAQKDDTANFEKLKQILEAG